MTIPFMPILDPPTIRKQKNWNFFHTYFKSMYPDMYNDMLKNLGTEPAPASVSGATQPQREERSREEDAAAWKVRIQDMLAGKTTIQGQVVGQNIPKLTGNEVGINSVINKWVTGKESGDIFEKLGKLGKVSIIGQMNNFNNTAHEKNIQQIINSNGRLGGAAMVYDPRTRKYHGISFSETDLSETTSNLVKSITGSSTGKKRTIVGNLPDVVELDGIVYDTTDGNDRLALMDAMQSKNEEYLQNNQDRIENKWRPSDEDIKGQQSPTGSTPTGMIDEYDTNLVAGKGDPLLPDYNIPSMEKTEAAAAEKEKIRLKAIETHQDKLVTSFDKPSQQDAIDAINEYDEKGYYEGGFIDQNDPQRNFSTNLSPRPDSGDTFQGRPELTETGFIGGQTPEQVTDEQSVADNIPIQGDKGDYIINAPAIENDPESFYEMLNKGLAEAGSQGINITDIPSDITQEGVGNILASAGEFKIEKPLAEIIGYDQLDMFNNAGKGEVQQRLAASGGFIDGYAGGGDVEEPAFRPSASLLNLHSAIKNRFSGGIIPARKTTKEFLNQLSDEEALALTAITEASVLGEKGLESVMHVVNNRIDSDYEDFKSQFNVMDVLNKQTAGGAFQFTGLEIKGIKGQADLRTHVDELITNPAAYKKYLKTVDMAREVLSGKRKDFTGGALFYYNPEQSTSQDFKDKVANRTYIPIYYMYGDSPKNRHVYFSPQEVYRPSLPESRPETPTEKIQKKFAQPSFLDSNKTTYSKKGMFATYLENRPSMQYN